MKENTQETAVMSLEALFCDVDDFCQVFFPQWEREQLTCGERQRWRSASLSVSEIMTVVIHFHPSHYRHVKGDYRGSVRGHLKGAFPRLVSYQRFVALIPSVLISLCAYLQRRKGQATRVAFIDATSIAVCHNRRIDRHQVFRKIAKRGKTSMGWFYGFKLHRVVNDRGERLAFHVTPGHADDRQPVPYLTEGLSGKRFGDKGSLSKHLFQVLFEKGLQLITPIRKNRHNRLFPLFDKLLLRKRSLIETLNDPLKNISQIEHSRHRRIAHFMVNLVVGLIAYTHQPLKPSLNLTSQQLILFDKPK